MFCIECGEQITLDAKFCARCGSKIEFDESRSINQDEPGSKTQSPTVVVSPVSQPNVNTKKTFPIKLTLSGMVFMAIIVYIYNLTPFHNNILSIAGISENNSIIGKWACQSTNLVTGKPDTNSSHISFSEDGNYDDIGYGNGSKSVSTGTFIKNSKQITVHLNRIVVDSVGLDINGNLEISTSKLNKNEFFFEAIGGINNRRNLHHRYECHRE